MNNPSEILHLLKPIKVRISLGYVSFVLEARQGETLVIHSIITLLTLSCSQRRYAKESYKSDSDHKRKIISAIVTCIHILGFHLRKVSPSSGCNIRVLLEPGPSVGHEIQSIFLQTSGQMADKEGAWDKVKPDLQNYEDIPDLLESLTSISSKRRNIQDCEWD